MNLVTLAKEIPVRDFQLLLAAYDSIWDKRRIKEETD